MRLVVRSSAFVLATLASVALTACPNGGNTDDAGTSLLTDGGTLEPPPPFDAGFNDAGDPLPPDGGVNGAVVVTSVDPPNGPLGGGNRVVINGDGFTPTSEVWFGAVQADPALVLPLVMPNSLSVAAVPPCTAPGPVDVRVINELGIGELVAGYTCFSPITIESIDPETGTTEGGTPVTLTGAGFTDDMVVLIGGRAAVSVDASDDGTTATLITPPGAPGAVDVVGVDTYGRSVLGYGFTYQSPLTLTDVEPAVVDDNGTVVELHGTGFFDTDVATVDVTIGGLAAARVNLISEARLRVQVPAGLTGMQDVVVTRDSETATLVDGIVVRPAATGALTLTGVVPARADIAGGSIHTLVGDALDTVTEVRVGGTLATNLTPVDARTLTFMAPIGTAGPAQISVNAGAAVLDGFEYERPVVINSIAPPSGDTAGGDSVTLTGRGFLGVEALTFGGIAATDVVVVTDSQITATTPPGAAGFVDVTATRDDGARGTLANEFLYEAPLKVMAVRPSRGALQGDTYVTVTGSGFSRGNIVSVAFADQLATDVQVVSDNIITLRTPTYYQGGSVDVTVTSSLSTDNVAIGSQLYNYFNASGNILAGAHGGPIDGAIYVTARDYNGFPIPGLVAYIGTSGSPIAAGITDQLGTATISGPGVVGHQTVSIMGDGFSSASWVDINATELTAYLLALGGEGEGEGEPPPPPPTIRGRVFGFAKEFFDPAALAPGEIAVAIVVTTDPDEFSGSPNPGGANAVFEEGGEYFIANARPGRLAVVALAGIFNQNTGEFRMRQMGVRREVYCNNGVNLIDQDIDLTIPLDAEVDLSMPDAPIRFDTTNIGFVPTITRVIPFMQFGGEGTLAYTQAVDGDRNHALEGMPDVPGPLMTFVAGAYTTDGRNLIIDTGSAQLTEGNRRVFGNNLGGVGWAIDDGFGGMFLQGQVFVAERPDGGRFASVIATVVGPGEIILDDAPPFSNDAWPYHIGQPGQPSSEVIQDGVGDLRGGVTIQPVLGLPELISPLENGVLVDRTLQWKAAPGQPPSIHDMFVYDPINLSCVWEFFVEGERGKVIIPEVPEYDAILAALPPRQQTLIAASDEYVPPGPMPPNGYWWLHDSIFVPNFDYTNWTQLGTIGTRGRRAWTSELHSFVKGAD